MCTSWSSSSCSSQRALPERACREVYASSGYGTRLANLNSISLASDNVFGDGGSLQLASISTDAASGYAASLSVGIAA
jgi:hypothetical protein